MSSIRFIDDFIHEGSRVIRNNKDEIIKLTKQLDEIKALLKANPTDSGLLIRQVEKVASIKTITAVTDDITKKVNSIESNAKVVSSDIGLTKEESIFKTSNIKKYVKYLTYGSMIGVSVYFTITAMARPSTMDGVECIITSLKNEGDFVVLSHESCKKEGNTVDKLDLCHDGLYIMGTSTGMDGNTYVVDSSQGNSIKLRCNVKITGTVNKGTFTIRANFNIADGIICAGGDLLPEFSFFDNIKIFFKKAGMIILYCFLSIIGIYFLFFLIKYFIKKKQKINTNNINNGF
jgi:hypothetical protein